MVEDPSNHEGSTRCGYMKHDPAGRPRWSTGRPCNGQRSGEWFDSITVESPDETPESEELVDRLRVGEIVRGDI